MKITHKFLVYSGSRCDICAIDENEYLTMHKKSKLCLCQNCRLIVRSKGVEKAKELVLDRLKRHVHVAISYTEDGDKPIDMIVDKLANDLNLSFTKQKATDDLGSMMIQHNGKVLHVFQLSGGNSHLIIARVDNDHCVLDMNDPDVFEKLLQAYERLLWLLL